MPIAPSLTSSSSSKPVSSAWAAFNGSRVPGVLGRVLALDDFEPLARGRLPRPLFGYVAGTVETGWSGRDNRAAFAQLGLVPRVLRNTAGRSTRTELLGQHWSAPFGIAPMGIAALSAWQGDLAMARAASQAGIPYVLSGSSLTPLETVMQAAPGSWFQAYLPGDEARINALLDRVAAAGVQTLVVTVDIPVAGNRENNIRAGFSTPLRPGLRLAWDGLVRPRWLLGTFLRTLWQGMPHFENSFAQRGAPILSREAARDFSSREHFDWSHMAAIRQRWRGQLVIKGILSPHDALAAREMGADAIIVSNHGGRQLDGAVSPLRVLPAVVRAAGDMPVLVDGGIRRGTDVLKALALGARFVFVGRPFNFAAAVARQSGVAHAIGLLQAEVDRDMAMLGITSPGQISAEFLQPLDGLAPAIH